MSTLFSFQKLRRFLLVPEHHTQSKCEQLAPAQPPQMEEPHLSLRTRTRITITHTQPGGRPGGDDPSMQPFGDPSVNPSHAAAVPTLGLTSYGIPLFFPPETLVLLRPAKTKGREKDETNKYTTTTTTNSSKHEEGGLFPNSGRW